MLQSNGDKNIKIVYMAPTKVLLLFILEFNAEYLQALCSERCNDWQKAFRTFGLTCIFFRLKRESIVLLTLENGIGNELTGDTDYAQQQEIRKSNIIVTTPEKWDSTTRRW